MTAEERRSALISWARKHIGETDSTPFVKAYNEAVGSSGMFVGAPWCACFVSAGAVETGMQDIIPPDVSCCNMIRKFEKIGRFIEDDDYTPTAGDIIFIDWDGTAGHESIGDEDTDHVGIVTAVSGGYIYCIEGNRRGAVKETAYAIGDRFISGFGVPDYGAEKEPAKEKKNKQLPLIKYGSSGDAVRAVQAILNVLDNAKLNVDGSFGSKTKAAVEHWQRNNCDADGNNLDPDGEVGPLTWGSFFVRV